MNMLNHLQLEITLQGSDFDGLLNFGAIILTNNGVQYPLDITDTAGFKHDNKYVLISKFEADVTEVMNTFSGFEGDYAFDVTTDLLIDAGTIGQINLHYNDEENASMANIERIISMKVVSTINPSIQVPVEQSDSL